MKQTFVLLWRPDKRMIQAIAITFMPEYHLIYETSRRCHESQRLNDCSIFALRGLCVGRCSRARNKLKSHRGKNHCGKTLLLLCNVCKSVGKGKERGERQIWKGGRKVQWLNETKEVCKKCQNMCRGMYRVLKKKKKEKRGKREARVWGGILGESMQRFSAGTRLTAQQTQISGVQSMADALGCWYPPLRLQTHSFLTQHEPISPLINHVTWLGLGVLAGPYFTQLDDFHTHTRAHVCTGGRYFPTFKRFTCKHGQTLYTLKHGVIPLPSLLWLHRFRKPLVIFFLNKHCLKLIDASLIRISAECWRVEHVCTFVSCVNHRFWFGRRGLRCRLWSCENAVRDSLSKDKLGLNSD